MFNLTTKLKYVVVERRNVDELSKQVQYLLDNGGSLVGGIALIGSGDLSSSYRHIIYAQAMMANHVVEDSR